MAAIIENIRTKQFGGIKMNKTNLLLDLGILSAFLIAAEPHLTGVTVHEWLGVAFGGTILIHLLLHWKWIVQIGSQYFKNLFHISRLKFLVDIVLLVAMTTLILSGILISKSFLSTLGIQVTVARSWKMIHASASSVALLMTALHFALNWGWVKTMTAKYLIAPLRALVPAKKLQPVVVPVKINK
jgi:hypothetical protein